MMGVMGMDVVETIGGSADDTSVAGQVVADRFVIVRVVGEGSFGVVYEAHDREADHRRVALKMLHADMEQNAEAVARFEREARAASMLKHPNGIEVLGVGREGDHHWLAMEFVEGESLDARLDRGPFRSLPEVVRIASQVCGALTAAHARGIVHRDLKPGNILLTRNPVDGGPHVKLCDFGIARLRPGLDPVDGRPLTTRGQVLGTPAYLAPEQARGDTIDHRCDVYALGVVLYEMTTGRLPFESESPYGVLAQHLTQPPPPPSTHDRRYPAALERIVLRCLEKDPRARFPTASILQGELEALLEDPTVHSWSSTTTPVLRPRASSDPDDLRATVSTPTDATLHTIDAAPEPPAPNTGDGPALEPFHVNRTDPALRVAPRRAEPQQAGGARTGLVLGIALAALAVVALLWLLMRGA